MIKYKEGVLEGRKKVVKMKEYDRKTSPE